MGSTRPVGKEAHSGYSIPGPGGFRNAAGCAPSGYRSLSKVVTDDGQQTQNIVSVRLPAPWSVGECCTIFRRNDPTAARGSVKYKPSQPPIRIP